MANHLLQVPVDVQVDEIWQTLLDLDVVDQVAVGARIDAAAELGDLPLALDLVAYIKKNRPLGSWGSCGVERSAGEVSW